MKCKNCNKEMFQWEQMMCYYAMCENKKCKFEGLVKIYNLKNSFEKSKELESLGEKDAK